jgi:hypothetical protein
VSGRLLKKESDTLSIITRLEILTAKATRRHEKSIGDRIIREKTVKIIIRSQALTAVIYRRSRAILR